MNKLLHYEIRKSGGTKLILLGITAVLELVFLAGILFNKDNVIGLGAILLFVAALGGIFFIGIQSVTILHRDMNTRQGYMLFMTPNSSYRILGAKVLENGLSLLLAGAFFAVLGFLDITLMMAHYGQLEQLWQTVNRVLTNIYPEFSLHWDTILAVLFAFLCSWLSTVVAAYLADVVATALLKGKKFGGFLAFVLFILIQLVIGWVQFRIRIPGNTVAYFLAEAALDLGFAVLMYCATAVIMERKLSI